MFSLRSVYGNEKGIVLPVVLMFLAIFSVMGSAAVVFTRTDLKIADNYKNSTVAFNLAEAGYERAKRTLKMTRARTLNIYLTGTSPGPYPFGATPQAGNSLGGGNYIVRIFDNDDGDDNLNNDTDYSLFIESKGFYRNSQKRIVALMRVALVPTPDGALETVHPTIKAKPRETEVELEKGSSIDGRDWIPPADLFSCTDVVNCGTLTTNPAIAGVSSNAAATATEVQVKAPASLYGSPPSKINTSLTPDPWDDLTDQVVIPNATRNFTVPQELITGNHTWGTPAAPEITVISATEIKFLNTQISGAGILIIQKNAEIEFESAILNWQGLVINRGRGINDPLLPPQPGFQNEIEVGDNAASALRLFGVLITGSSIPGPEVEVEFQNNRTFVKYSSSSLDMVRELLPTGIKGWQEIM